VGPRLRQILDVFDYGGLGGAEEAKPGQSHGSRIFGIAGLPLFFVAKILNLIKKVMNMYKLKLIRPIIVLTVSMLIMAAGVLSYASESMYDIYQRDRKLRLVVKFKDFIADRISVKLA